MEKSPTLLILHDGGGVPDELAGALEGGGWRISTARFKDARLAVSSKTPDCVVLALDGDGKEAAGILEVVRSYDDNLPLLAVAPSAELKDAVEIMKAGAYDFHISPLDGERLRNSIEHAVKLYGLTKKVFLLESQVGWRTGLDEMVGQSSGMQEVYQLVQMVARSNATVLILGESGTGKELVAKAVHRLGPRKKKVFIDINCGAIPRELLENELFGHERGAYTGADRQYKGSCEVADGGTLFLDEISEMDPSLQVKMLRFLQERSFTRVGGTQPVSVDVKVIAATNRDLEKEVAEGRFREDLFYRLNVVPIRVPPLKERREDVAPLARHFIEKYSTKYERMFIDVAPQAMEALASYEWPGNVRELENIVERITVLNNDSQIQLKHLPPEIQGARRQGGEAVLAGPALAPDAGQIIPLKLVEKYAIEAALARCLGNVAEASKKLKVSQATLYRKIKQYGLKT
jgi:DNA-binding NtrC family response regulator